MIQTALIPNAHTDLVTDACYDTYGLYLATCGVDQRIKVWVLEEESGSWKLEDDWKAHEAAVTKISWAHPTFGSVIASSSFDRTVKIWEQMHADSDAQASGSGSSGGSTRWVERAVFLDAKDSVRAVEFAPYHFGMKLAAISSDNHLRIYECLEQPALANWQLVDEVDMPALPKHAVGGPSSLSNTVATSTPTPTQMGTSALDGASVTSLLQAAQQQNAAQQGAGRPGLGSREADGGWCVSWCKERYWGEVLAVGSGVGGIVKIIQFSSHRRPQTLFSLEPTPPPSSSAPPLGRAGSLRSGAYSAVASGASNGEVPYAVTSIAWAPSCGRSFHLIATGSRDGHVRIWKVKPPPPSAPSPSAGADLGDEDIGMNSLDEKWSANLVAEFDDHKSSVGRVEWNITGTVLSSAGNDGRVRLWKQTVGGVWRPAGHISVEQAEERPQTADVEMDENAGAD
ncbi:hypothetical protein EW145_g5942 [Phellinidium pouzarii]|uniref:Anaphase-promoting complex subunit 4 WD40 domain-containing protein n=1 Tax=Phellinidium pouzarii TaxID=167371 RepID=A0A4S4L313_9AGAM|nr:hypothetical protein EW145_g5942 [Phellinidium pouzarii]